MVTEVLRMANYKNILCVIFSALMLCASFAFAGISQPIGQVTLVIGTGHRIDTGGNKSVIRKGDSLHEGDKLETRAGGHVHIRFIDGALVSVRPSSKLTVEAYNKDETGASGVIRFKLDAGTMRSVTGQWGEANHDRFRLNTPIAAIGIRGTDFVVQAETDRVRVVVQSGAIVMAPLDGIQCQQSGLGVCNTTAAKRLSAEMGDVMLELRRRQTAPELIQLRDLLPAERLQSGEPIKEKTNEQGKEQPIKSSSQDKNPNTLQVENATNQNVAQKLPLLAQEKITPPIEVERVPAPLPPVAEPEVVTPPTQPIVTPPIIKNSQLSWARMYPAWVGDNLSKSYTEASAGRQVTVGNSNGQYLLYRKGDADDIDMRSIFASGLGRVNFNLEFSQANLVRDGVSEIAKVQSGTLGIDFSKRQFDTAISVSNEKTGIVKIEAQGEINRFTGIMFGGDINKDGRVVGALSTDGQEAGLAFDRQTDKGLVSGITLWGR
jgi:hypothetical protein